MYALFSLKSFFLLFFLWLPAAFAASVTIGWDAADGNPDIGGYLVHIGTEPGVYTQSIDAGLTSQTTIDGLDEVKLYYFSVTAYPAVDSEYLESAHSREIYLSIVDASNKVQADYLASSLQGPAPLTVLFADNSTGDINSWAWFYGDGNIGIGREVMHTYSEPGKYVVWLVVSGALGGNAKQILVEVTD